MSIDEIVAMLKSGSKIALENEQLPELKAEEMNLVSGGNEGGGGGGGGYM